MCHCANSYVSSVSTYNSTQAVQAAALPCDCLCHPCAHWLGAPLVCLFALIVEVASLLLLVLAEWARICR